VYSTYDKVGKNYITEKEFIATSIYFFSPQFEDKLKIVFDLLDFNQDLKIEASDIHRLISHVPLQKRTEDKETETGSAIKLKLDQVNPEDRIESLEEIQELAEYLFRHDKYMTFEQFKTVIETQCSDLFITVIFYYNLGLFPFKTENTFLQASSIIYL